MYAGALASTFASNNDNQYLGYLIYQNDLASARDIIRSGAPYNRTSDLRNLCGKMGPYQITPLMLAVMLDRYDIIAELLNTGYSDINAQDVKGFTALHHAAIKTNRVLMDLLLANRADPRIVENNQGTPEELYRLTHWQDNSHLKSVYEEQEINAACFKARTGAELIDETHIDPVHVIKQWINLTPLYINSVALEDCTSRSYESFRLAPPKLGLKNTPPIGLGTYAVNQIAPEEIVSEYVGEWIGHRTVGDPTYYMNPISSSKYRNLASHIQDGHPNVIPLAVEAKKGLAQRTVFVALCAIAKGDLILFDYGQMHNPAKMDCCYIELNKAATRELLQRRGVEQFIQETCNFELEDHSSAEIYDYMALRYIANTPHVILSLLCEDVISYPQLVAIKNHTDFIDTVLCSSWNDLESNFLVFNDRPSPRQASFKRHLTETLKTESTRICLLLSWLYNKYFVQHCRENEEISYQLWSNQINDIKRKFAGKYQP